MPKEKVSAEQRRAIRDARKMIEEHMKEDGNEAETISSGVYLVRATTDEGQQITKRIVYLK